MARMQELKQHLDGTVHGFRAAQLEMADVAGIGQSIVRPQTVRRHG